eukprot:Rmarinus@m.19168
MFSSLRTPLATQGRSLTTAVIAASVRTPIGSYGGALSSFSAPQLGSLTIREALKRTGVKNIENDVDEVFYGNVLSAGIGQAPARQATLGAGISNKTPCTTVHKVCASGMKAIMFAAQSTMLGHGSVFVAGGMESMSNVPYYVDKARFGYRMGHGQIHDGMIKDGLWCVYNDFHMGNCGEICSTKFDIPRSEQDAHAQRSYERALAAYKDNVFADEILPVTVKSRKGEKVVSEDEEYKNVDVSKIPSLRPAFKKDGSVTAANASVLSDGASAVVVMSEAKAKDSGAPILAKIRGFSDAATLPEDFTVAPALAIPIALERAGVKPSEVDLYEINEAFSVVACVNQKKLNIDVDRLNIYGGAVSLGHPLGASGSRIVNTLLTGLKRTGGRIGCAAICNGGGGASAIVIERVD